MGPRAGAERLAIRLRVVEPPPPPPPSQPAVPGHVLSGLRERRRNFRGGGEGACVIGGVGSWECDEVGGVDGSVGCAPEAASRLWRERHVVKMFPIAFWVDSWGGLAGGEVKRAADWSRVTGGVCDERDWRESRDSQVRAEGSSILKTETETEPARKMLVSLYWLSDKEEEDKSRQCLYCGLKGGTRSSLRLDRDPSLVAISFARAKKCDGARSRGLTTTTTTTTTTATTATWLRRRRLGLSRVRRGGMQQEKKK